MSLGNKWDGRLGGLPPRWGGRSDCFIGSPGCETLSKSRGPSELMSRGVCSGYGLLVLESRGSRVFPCCSC